jgi:hypothetical protein
VVQEVHRLKKKLRQKESADADRMSSLIAQGGKSESPIGSPPHSGSFIGSSSSSSSASSSPSTTSKKGHNTEKELHVLKENLKKKEKEERRSFDKINKLKKERDEFAAERAALQVLLQPLTAVL